MKKLYLDRTDLFRNAIRTGKFGVRNKIILVCKARDCGFQYLWTFIVELIFCTKTSNNNN